MGDERDLLAKLGVLGQEGVKGGEAAQDVLGEVRAVNPFDIQEQADTIYRALTMDPEERRLRAARLREIVRARDPGVWIQEQLDDIELKRSGS